MICDPLSASFLPDSPQEIGPIEQDVPAHGARPPRYRLSTANDLRTLPDLQWAVRSILPAKGLATIYGASASGKSFLALDLMASLGEASSWFGHGVAKPLHVASLVLEGEAGFRRRVAAWERAHSRPFTERVKFTYEAFNLFDGGDLSALAESIRAKGGCDALFIDTLNRAMPGADENSARDASTALANLGWLQQALGCLIVVVHHTGKNALAGMRGHSSLFAAMDAVIEVKRTAGARSWSVAKSKDDIDGASHSFALETVELGHDFMDKPITSCVIRSLDRSVDQAPRPPKSKNQRIIYDALQPLFEQSAVFGKGNAPITKPCLLLEDVIPKVKDRLAVEPKRMGERARECIGGMVAAGVLGLEEGWIWRK